MAREYEGAKRECLTNIIERRCFRVFNRPFGKIEMMGFQVNLARLQNKRLAQIPEYVESKVDRVCTKIQDSYGSRFTRVLFAGGVI
jgi:hypothetical protein